MTFSPTSAALAAVPTSRKKTFFYVQGLRGLAALIVVVFHGTLEMRRVVDHSFPLFSLGAGGVDIFFVISGFVMTLSSASLLQRPRAGQVFMLRRLQRIVPLYWIITICQLIVTYAAPNLQEPNTGGAGRVFASFLFLPISGFPIVTQGWTLNYEMLFYVLFSLGVALKVKPLRFVAPALVVLVGSYHFVSSRGWPLAGLCDPVMLEFIYGMILGILTMNTKLLRNRRVWAASAVCVLLFALTFHVNLLSRPYHQGIPALILVAVAVALESKVEWRTPKIILELGNASYSIYLVHVLVMAFLFPLLIKGPFKGVWAEDAFIAVYVLVATLAGVICYRFVELPIIGYFQQKRPVGPTKA